MIDRRTFLSSAVLGTAGLLAQRAHLARSADNTIMLTAEETNFSLAKGEMAESPFWLYNGQTPGPEIRVKKGQTLRIKLINKLPEPTSIHWHGIRIANAMDGVAGLTQPAVESGGEFDYEFVVPDSGTYWYHAHNRSWNEVARGLYGPLIVEEPDNPFDAEHDLLLVIDDWRVDQTGALDLDSLGAMMDWNHAGRLGNVLTVNSKFESEFHLRSGEAYRLRLINASNARTYSIDMGGLDAQVIALDGQPLVQPSVFGKSPLQLTAAQRADLLFIPEKAGSFALDVVVRDQRLAIARFKVEGEGRQSSHIPSLTPSNLPDPDIANARRIQLDMTGGAMGNFVETTYQGKILTRDDIFATKQVWAFNGIANLAENPLFLASRGESIVLETTNRTAFPHAIHLHGHHLRVLEKRGSEPETSGHWRDTFLIDPDQRIDIAFVADNPGKWLLHCHMLEHAAAGMNTWFEIS